ARNYLLLTRQASNHGLSELQDEAVLRVIHLPEGLRARIVWIAQNVQRRDQFEAVFFDLLDHELLIDAMERVGVADARTGLRAVIDDAIDAARLERLEHSGVELVGIGTHVEEVVIIEIDEHSVERAGRHRYQ